MKAKPYIVLTPIEHDHRRYDIGENISLDEETAQPLLACGAVVEPAGKANKEATE